MLELIKSKILKKSDLGKIRRKHASKKIVFCTGCYDILQSGHAIFFDQCKKYGDVLVVGVGRDQVVSKLKGPGRPVNPENNRVFLVAAIHEVDYAVLNDKKISRGKIDFENIIANLKPDVFVLNDDDSDIVSKKELCRICGIKFRLVPRIAPKGLKATSSTRIIDKIKMRS